ncbi:hypothetical protein Pmani_024321 [Petrolisthes manimaculis]|uniref:Uncharacterized protein n=1 Tax=Petrolisthes manimaculis TaxID=1843537 RepID=A0AAE1U067_9EUCA|nr:hypothetical protein Pmani_024321 [Petrolisthes manimaculis]
MVLRDKATPNFISTTPCTPVPRGGDEGGGGVVGGIQGPVHLHLNLPHHHPPPPPRQEEEEEEEKEELKEGKGKEGEDEKIVLGRMNMNTKEGKEEDELGRMNPNTYTSPSSPSPTPTPTPRQKKGTKKKKKEEEEKGTEYKKEDLKESKSVNVMLNRHRVVEKAPSTLSHTDDWLSSFFIRTPSSTNTTSLTFQ